MRRIVSFRVVFLTWLLILIVEVFTGRFFMAKLVVVAVRDRAIDCFMNPFVCPSTGMALRSFQDEVNAKDSPMNKHPDDYELYVLGSFDQESGEFVNERKLLMLAKNMVTTKE